MRLTRMMLPRICAAAILCFSQLACGQKKPVASFTGSYDLSRPQKFNMPDGLLEISGLAFYKGNPDTIYAEQDEKGRLYRFHPGDKKLLYSTFGSDGDYEDLAILKEQVFMLKSNGVLFSFPMSEASSGEISNVSEYKKLVPKGEYEGLYADEKEDRLYLLCKTCEETGAGGYIIGFDRDRMPEIKGQFTIELAYYAGKDGKKKNRFRPSAITRHPSSGEWYILSSVNKLLLITDPEFRAKGSYSLKSGVFLQPEGIAFDKDMNLYISNEGDELSAGNVLKFKPLK